MLPNSGRNLPNSRPALSERDFAERISAALRSELGGTRTSVKTIMRWTGASDRSARTWLNGTGAPSGYHVICLARESDEVLTLLLELSGRSAIAFNLDLHAVEVALARATGALEMLRRQRSPTSKG